MLPKYRIMYVELQTGYPLHAGPAWIGKVMFSKSGRTVYFNGKALGKAEGPYSNHMDLETGDQYWVSGVKKNAQDRHWAGSGKIVVDKKVVDEYLELTGQENLDKRKFEVVEIEDNFPVEKINKMANETLENAWPNRRYHR